MDLSAEIDRGDVWYDFPFDAAGARLPQPRERFPPFTLFVKWRGERVPLVRWRTTVGGWRAELARDGQEYYRYKGSDVGPRVWRHIVAAPVWIPPPSSPLGVDGEGEAGQRHVRASVTNYDETGPGLPVGLRAGRRPSTSEMRKGPDGHALLRQRHPHARLVRLHVAARALLARLPSPLQPPGDAPVLVRARAPARADARLDRRSGFRRTFWSKGEVFEMRLPSRGFYYELDPPLPVETLEGRIKGTLQKPIAGYVPKPGVKYSNDRAPSLLVRFAGEQGGRRGAAVTPARAALPLALVACALACDGKRAAAPVAVEPAEHVDASRPPTRSHLRRTMRRRRW